MRWERERKEKVMDGEKMGKKKPVDFKYKSQRRNYLNQFNKETHIIM